MQLNCDFGLIVNIKLQINRLEVKKSFMKVYLQTVDKINKKSEHF
jgi:hypothetical protein